MEGAKEKIQAYVLPGTLHNHTCTSGRAILVCADTLGPLTIRVNRW